MSLIQCQGLSKQFAEKTVLHDLSFDLPNGQPIALVGPNGAGKTTLFSILCGYIRPTSGSVSILGKAPGSPELFGRVSALPQDAQLDPRFSICRQLVLYAQLQGFNRRNARIEAERVLSLMQLSDVLHQKPAVLSHGMRKRVTIAQALIGAPELVLLDEPTAGLDPVNARNIRDLVSDHSNNTTFIISSHNLSELEELCNTVLHLSNGRLQQQVDLTGTQETQNPLSYLTVHMDNCPADAFIRRISDLPGVESVEARQKNHFLISYYLINTSPLDQALLQCIKDSQWDYRQIIKGKTLEEQLFANA
ncbi:MAG: ABC transporter ATP-binding protein [Pseudomonadales bacterium]|nr:ABC transporter ATP-binding protein [Pseudomonadales bacterium]